METLSENIYRIEIPLPFPLKWLYSYAVKGRNGWTIIDAGLHTKETELVWKEFIKEQQIDFSDIHKIILTHYHPDHYGAAGWLQQKTGASVYMSNIDYSEANLFWHGKNDMGTGMQDFYIHHGMPKDIASQMIMHMNEFIPWVTPKPEVTFLDDGDKISIGDDEYVAIHTPGHTYGHLCFYQPEKKILFSGDHILPKITPNVSLWPDGLDKDPLRSFIQSLNKIKAYDIQVTYPAHKATCVDVHQRIEDILDHHEKRLHEVMNWVGEEATGFEVCEKMFGSKLSVHQLRFAMAETLAHLAYLESENRLVSRNKEGIIHWYPVDKAS